MSESYVVLSAELPDLEVLYPVIEAESQSRRQLLFLQFVNEQFDFEYEEDLVVEDIAIEGERLIVEYQCSTGLCHEVTQALFEGLAENEASGLIALEYNSRVGMYSCLVPGYDEAEPIDDCFEDFGGLMQELEDFMDQREQLLKIIELSESEPLKSALREYLQGDESEEGENDEFDDDDDDDAVEDEDEDYYEEEEDAFGESEDEAIGDSASRRDRLMEALEQAMADGDDELASELFEQVQDLSRNE